MSRVGAALELLFFAPGDWLLWAMLTYTPPVAAFFELSTADYGGLLSGVVSALVWLTVLLLLTITYSAVRELDQALTYGAVRLYREAGRRVRVVRNRLLAYRAARRARRAAVRSEPVIREDAPAASQEVEVGVAELRVLHEHAKLPAGYALTLSDTVEALGARKSDVQTILNRLMTLKLLTTVGGRDGESAYRLTPAGHAYLTFRRAAGDGRRAAGTGR